jgi:hypothetical protein
MRACKISFRRHSHLGSKAYAARPDIKARVESLRRNSPAQALEDVRDTVEELLSATDKEGNPDWAARARGVELAMKHEDRFAEVDLCAMGELPAGAWVVFPPAFVED